VEKDIKVNLAKKHRDKIEIKKITLKKIELFQKEGYS